MTSFNVQTQGYFEDEKQIETIFQAAISYKIVNSSELPSIPLAQSIPPPSPLIESIKLGNFSNRIESFSITQYFHKRRDSFFVFELSKKFIEINRVNLNKDATFKYCRSATLRFSDEVMSFLDTFGKFYLYSDFDSFDLKVGTDIREKIIVLNPIEYEIFQHDLLKIQNWNQRILSVQSESVRLKYRLSELLNK